MQLLVLLCMTRDGLLKTFWKLADIFKGNINGFTITLILHQIFIFSNKVKHPAGWKKSIYHFHSLESSPIPFPPTEWTNWILYICIYWIQNSINFCIIIFSTSYVQEDGFRELDENIEVNNFMVQLFLN